MLYQALHSLGEELKGKTVVVQGFGNVGGTAARILWRDGAVIQAVSDYKGGVWNSQGLDIRLLEEHVKESGSVVGFPGRTPSPIPTSSSSRATSCSPPPPAPRSGRTMPTRSRPASSSKGPTAPPPPKRTRSCAPASVIVVPDILANAGGVVVSYFEWVQGLQFYFWKESEIIARLQEIMTRAFTRVWNVSKRENVDLRTAALMEGVRRVADAHQIRGLYP